MLHGHSACRHLPHLAGLRCRAAASCQACARLPLRVLALLLEHFATAMQPSIAGEGRWQGHRPCFVEGSGGSLPDAPAPKHLRQPPTTRIEPIPTPPPLQTGEGIAGRWEGQYQCQHQLIGCSLEISNGGGNQIAAIFEFFPLPGTLSIQRGSFRMAGDYNHTDGTIRLSSTGWIKRPLGFQSHDIEGRLEDPGKGISGRVLTTGCAHFMLTRK